MPWDSWLEVGNDLSSGYSVIYGIERAYVTYVCHLSLVLNGDHWISDQLCFSGPCNSKEACSQSVVAEI